MKATGIVRRIDRLGRIVLPTELRAQLLIDETTPAEVYHDSSFIVIVKHEPGCVFCGGTEELSMVSQIHTTFPDGGRGCR